MSRVYYHASKENDCNHLPHECRLTIFNDIYYSVENDEDKDIWNLSHETIDFNNIMSKTLGYRDCFVTTNSMARVKMNIDVEHSTDNLFLALMNEICRACPVDRDHIIYHFCQGMDRFVLEIPDIDHWNASHRFLKKHFSGVDKLTTPKIFSLLTHETGELSYNRKYYRFGIKRDRFLQKLQENLLTIASAVMLIGVGSILLCS